MLYFGVTLRCKAVAKNWEHVVRDFHRTLRSICQQTDPDFRVIVACHEIPDMPGGYDERVEFLQADIPFPTTPHEMMQDKGYKLSMIGKRIRELGGGYTMIVDADDLISNRVAAYVNAHPGQNGFAPKYGYVHVMGEKSVRRTLHPDQICGSCIVVNYTVDDLPAELPSSPQDESAKGYILRKAHPTIRPHMAEIGRPLAELPFPATVYIRGTGDNHSMIGGGRLGLKRRLEQLLRREIPLHKIAAEFGMEDFCG